MLKNRNIRRVTKRVYDQYSFTDYSTLPDNLNPMNPTQLESQFSEILQSVKVKIINAYEKRNVTVPEDVYEPDTSPSSLLNDVEGLINKIKDNDFSNTITDKFDNNLGVINSLINTVGPCPDKDPYPAYLGSSPLKLDCEGIEDTLNQLASLNSSSSDEDNDSDSDSDSDSSDGTDSSSSSANSGLIKITYKGLQSSEDMIKYPTELLEAECPITLQIPTEIPSNKYFAGWYFDENYNTEVANRKLDWPGKDITVYAYFKGYDDGSEGENTQDANDLNLGDTDNGDDCDIIELQFLKIILIMIIVVQLLVKVFTLTLNITKAAADIAKEAQLCWINPPLLTSLIAYVLQRLSAVIFQIVGIILLKVWAMLNLDCIGKNTLNTIDQINSALAGITDIIGSVDALAVNFSDNNTDYWKSVEDALTNLKKQLVKQSADVWKSMSNIKDQFKDLGKDLGDTYSNPATYLAAIPSEISSDIIDQIDAISTVKANITNLQKTINKITERSKKKKENKNSETELKGVESTNYD